MTYRVVPVSELMTYEFDMIEAGFEALNDDVLKSIAINGDVPVLREQLQSGDYVLLCKAPVLPLLHLKKNAEDKQVWSINEKARHAVDKAVQNALQNCIKAAEEKAQTNKESAALLSNNDPVANYEPEPVQLSRTASPPKADFEYCFDVACSDHSFVTNVCCSFSLSRTSSEATISHWEKNASSAGTHYTATAYSDEPRKLIATIGSMQLGISSQPVQLHKMGEHSAKESFIPIIPAVQFGPRLGLPTFGYYYHFLHTQLIQEYKVVGRGNWSFFATRSTAQHLDSDQGANKYQSAILLLCQRNGQQVTGQSVLYSAIPLTSEQLVTMTEDWLTHNAVKIEPFKLLNTLNEPVIHGDESLDGLAQPAIPPAIFNHPKNVHYALDERYLISGQVKSINTPSLLENDIVVVNLKNLSGTSMALDA
ncbi:hypothetical protein [Vibrio palustris]|uniref:Uncharacterized protein n=1 Tax=Vibrio palustris TaxID=1918946 RepID=A0A1R4B141_9VIBR|nr:hypothetical protein [Vibrio palustris]SJL82597.1 hypothetical protein VPAL9027_00527 [Vibrio palustris]